MKNLLKKFGSVLMVFGLLLSFGSNAEAATPAYGGANSASVTQTSATLTGTFNPKGLNTYAWFEMQNNPGVKLAYMNIGSGNSEVTIYHYLTNLTPGTSYSFRAVAQNTTTESGVTSGTTWGSWQTFTTLSNSEGNCTSGCNNCTTCCYNNCNTTPLPVVNVSANPQTVVSGSSTTISWSSTNATSCSMSSNSWNGTLMSTSGSKVFYPNYSTTYTVTCTNNTGSASDSVYVTVNPAVDPNPVYVPTVNLTASPISLSYGGSSTLSWTSTNANSCYASNGWSGTKNTSGSYATGSLTSNKTYTITCTGNGGSASDTVYVSVASAPDPVYTPTVNLVANPTSVAYGGNAALSWTSTNANSCYASNGWSGTKTASGSYTLSNLTTTKTYTITCTGNGGSASDTVSIGVTSEPDPVYTPTVNLTINSTAVAYNGNVTLSWTSTNATSCVASNGWSGNKNTSGTETKYNLTSGKTYTITCTGNGGSASDTVSVAVGDNNQNVNPTVITNSPSGITTNYAVLNGTVSANGGNSVRAWFEWGTNGNMTNQTNQTNYGTANNTNYSYSLGGLSSNTTYYYRAVAQNDGGQMVYGNQMSFTTTGNNNGCTYNCYGNTLVNVTTYQATENYGNSAILNGYVETNGNYTVRWFEYGNTGTFLGLQTNKINQGASSGNFNQIVTGLQSNTTYYYRAAAQSNNGQVVYGNVLTFTTSGNYNNNTCNGYNCEPTAITTLATNVDYNSARLNGLGIVNGTINTNGYFEYGETYALGRTTTNGFIGNSSSSPFYSSLFNLSPNTTYYYRAIVTNQYGTARGEIRTFRTRSNSSVLSANTNTNTTKTTNIIYREVVPVTNVVTTNTGVGLSKSSLVFLTINRNDEVIGVGNTFDYIVNYKNVSNENLRNLILKVVLPKELSFVNTSRGTFSNDDNTLIVNIDSLYPQEEGSVVVRVVADRNVAIGKIIVTTANMVYTVSNTNIQEEVFAYSKNTFDNLNGQVAGAAIFGASFFPNTLVGWLLLILIILLIILAIRMAYQNHRTVRVVNDMNTNHNNHSHTH